MTCCPLPTTPHGCAPLGAGDTLDTIAQYFNIPRASIVAANPDLNPATLAVNSFVRLPPYADTCPAPGDNKQCRYYVAQLGDSLSQIATAFSIDLADLQVGPFVHTACPGPPELGLCKAAARLPPLLSTLRPTTATLHAITIGCPLPGCQPHSGRVYRRRHYCTAARPAN